TVHARWNRLHVGRRARSLCRRRAHHHHGPLCGQWFQEPAQERTRGRIHSYGRAKGRRHSLSRKPDGHRIFAQSTLFQSVDRGRKSMKYVTNFSRIVVLTAFTMGLPMISAVACSDSDSNGVSVGVDLEAPSSVKQSLTAKTWSTDLGYTV